MEIIKTLKSKDGIAKKFLQQTVDGHVIETGYFELDERILCISSQVGCAMGCIFCATSLPATKKNSKAFVRNLSAQEIVQQAKNVLSAAAEDSRPNKKILFSFMGMGEPFLNYKNMVASIKTLGRQFSRSRATVATTGINSALMKHLAHEKFPITVKLHLSLHAPNDALRSRIMPNAKPMQPALEALRYFAARTKTIEKINYLPLAGINDSKSCAIQLSNRLQPYPFVVKFSVLNKLGNLRPASTGTVAMFEKVLQARGIPTCRFASDGPDIKVGCGQLRQHFSKNFRRTVPKTNQR